MDDTPELTVPRKLVGLAGLLCLAATLLVAAVPVSAVGRYVITFEGGELPADVEGLVASLQPLDGVALHALGAVVVTAPEAAIASVRDRVDVAAVRPERRIEFHLAQSVPFIGAGADLLGQPRAVPTADGDVTRPAVDGSGVTVAVVDTGIWADHPDLSDRVIAALDFELAYAAELLMTPEQLDDFAAAMGPLAGPTDDVGHGTHVAGIVAGTGAAAQGKANDNAGVAPGAAIVDLRISPQAHTSDNNVGWERNALAAYDWLVRHHADEAFGPSGIRVVNNSWGVGPSTIDGEDLDYEPMAAALTALFEDDVVVVFSAGNSGQGDWVTEEVVPTGHPTVITVAAGCHPGADSSGCKPAEPDAAIGSFSSWGPAVDITAPGVDILSAVNASSGKVLGSLGGDYDGGSTAATANNRLWYANFSGTSMSGPHIAGVVALMLEVSPTLTPHEARYLLTATARDLLWPGRDPRSGWGMVDVTGVLDAAALHAAGADVSELFPAHDDATTR